MKKYKSKTTGEEFIYIIKRNGFVILIPASEEYNLNPFEEWVWEEDFANSFEPLEPEAKKMECEHQYPKITKLLTIIRGGKAFIECIKCGHEVEDKEYQCNHRFIRPVLGAKPHAICATCGVKISEDRVIVKMVPIPESEWKWFGYPGHLRVSAYCQFHLCTQVGEYLISTVGDYRPDGIFRRKENLGCSELGEEFFMTSVFNAGRICDNPNCGCEIPEIEGGSIESIGTITSSEATARHMELCHKYANLRE